MNFLFDIEQQEALDNASNITRGLFGESKAEIREKGKKNLLIVGGVSALIILMLIFKKK